MQSSCLHSAEHNYSSSLEASNGGYSTAGNTPFGQICDYLNIQSCQSGDGDSTPTLRYFLGHDGSTTEEDPFTVKLDKDFNTDADVEELSSECTSIGSPTFSSSTGSTSADTEDCNLFEGELWGDLIIASDVSAPEQHLHDFQHDQNLGDLFFSVQPSELGSISCAECGKHFETFIKLEKHGRDKRHLAFQCHYPSCLKKLARRDTLKRHMDNHNHFPQLGCKHCEESGTIKRFKRRDHLLQHIKRCHHQNRELSAEDRMKETLRSMVRSLQSVLPDLVALESQIDTLSAHATQMLLHDLARHIQQKTAAELTNSPTYVV